MKSSIFPILTVVILVFTACSDDNPTLGSDLISPDEQVKLESVTTDTINGFRFSVTYEDYNPVTSNASYLTVGETSNPRAGNLKTQAAIRLISGSQNGFNPDSLVSVLEAKLFLTPSAINLGDTTKPFTLQVHELQTLPVFSGLKLKDQPAVGSMVADTTFSGALRSRFSFMISNRTWVENLLKLFSNTSDTLVLNQYSKGLLLSSPASNGRSVGLFGFASNLSFFGYLDDPEVRVRTVVKNGNQSTDTLTVTFTLGSANQLSSFTPGPVFSDPNVVGIYALSGKRAKLTFDSSLIPSKATIFSGKLLFSDITADTTLYRRSMFISLTSINPTDQSATSPLNSSRLDDNRKLTFSISTIMQYWSLRGAGPGLFLIPGSEASATDYMEFSLDPAVSTTRPVLSLVFSRR